MDAGGVTDEIRAHLGPVLAESGVEIDEVAIHPAGKRRLVRVTVARSLAAVPVEDDASPIEPLTLDEVAEATRAVSQWLDEAGDDLFGATPYTLEVSSPGVGAPLLGFPAFRRNVGRLITLVHSDGDGPPADSGRDTERLVAASPEGIRLEGDPEATVPYDRITSAKVEVEFNSGAGAKQKRNGRGKDR